MLQAVEYREYTDILAKKENIESEREDVNLAMRSVLADIKHGVSVNILCSFLNTSFILH